MSITRRFSVVLILIPSPCLRHGGKIHTCGDV
jgi:hypothetical protein